MGLRGSVKAFSLNQLLEFLTASGHRGTLDTFHEDAQKTLFLHQQALYLEKSNWSFRLGDALVRTKQITPKQLDEGLEHQKNSEGKRLGDCLKELGHITDAHILAARRLQTEEEIYELFSWEDAFFEFKKGELPEDFTERIEDPEEFRFPVHSILMEAARRVDELERIQETLPSEKRLYVLSGEESAARAQKGLEGAHARVTDPAEVFDGRKTLGELPHLLGLSRFETKAMITLLICDGAHVKPIPRKDLESRFSSALKGDNEDIDYALKLYECALESPQFDSRGRFLDRVIFGSKSFKQSASEGKINFSARIKGKRAFELLLALFRQGVSVEFTAKEEGHALQLGFSKSSLVWRVEEGQTPPSIVKHLLARSPVSASDLVRVREMQEQTGRSLQQILVGGGYVTMDNWFRAQKDTVLNEMFNIFFLRMPYIEIKTGEERGKGNPGLDIDVPLLPWLQAEVMREIREWESILATIPSVRSYLVLTSKGERTLRGEDDPHRLFDGQRSLEEVVKLQEGSAQEFLSDIYAKLQNGRLAQLEPDEYKSRMEAALKAGKRKEAIDFCLAAIESNIEPRHFKNRLRELEAAESEISLQSARATLEGDLKSYSLPELLQTFNLGKRSGTMRVEVKGSNKLVRQIYFDQGDVFLLSGEMEEALSDNDLESGFLAAGLITEDQLADAAASQMKDEVYEMFLWEGAEFQFSDYLPAEFYETKAHRKIKLNTQRFLLEAVRRISDWEDVRKLLPSDDMVLAFDNNTSKMDAVRELGNEDLLLLVDGRHAMADLVRMSRMRRFKALSLLAELVRRETLKVVDLSAIEEEDEDALFSSDLPTSGVIEGGFVGQIQFVGTLQDLSMAKMTGVMRLTDGRRSKELALIDGEIYRTRPYVPLTKEEKKAKTAVAMASPEAQRLAELIEMDLEGLDDGARRKIEMEMKMLRMVIAQESEEAGPSGGDDDQQSDEAQRVAELEAMDMSDLSEDEAKKRKTELMMLRAAVEQAEEQRKKEQLEAITREAAVDTGQEVAECFSWRGTRFELLQGTLPPKLKSPDTRDDYKCHSESFFDVFAEAGEKWVMVGEMVPKDLWVVWTDEDNASAAREKAGDRPDLVELVAAENTPEDIARMSGARYKAYAWLAELFQEGLVEGIEPHQEEGDSEEDWDFSL